MQNNGGRRPVPPYNPPPPVITQESRVKPSETKLTRELEVVDLNSYASRKSAIGGALGISLFTSNTDQLVTLINRADQWSNLQSVTFWLIVFSLFLQV